MASPRARAGRGLLGAGMVIASGGSTRAAAAEPEEAVHLELHAGVGCPDEAVFEARVRARTGRARFVGEGEAARTFVVEVAGGRPAKGRMTVRRGSATEGGRDVRGGTCAPRAAGIVVNATDIYWSTPGGSIYRVREP